MGNTRRSDLPLEEGNTRTESRGRVQLYPYRGQLYPDPTSDLVHAPLVKIQKLFLYIFFIQAPPSPPRPPRHSHSTAPSRPKTNRDAPRQAKNIFSAETLAHNGRAALRLRRRA